MTFSYGVYLQCITFGSHKVQSHDFEPIRRVDNIKNNKFCGRKVTFQINVFEYAKLLWRR